MLVLAIKGNLFTIEISSLLSGLFTIFEFTHDTRNFPLFAEEWIYGIHMQFNAYKHTNIQVCMHAQIHLISMGLAQAYPIILEEVDDIFILEGLDNVIVLEAYTGRNAF